MYKQLKQHITDNLPFLTESKLLIAISGGLDSVLLTHLCHKLKLDIALAHCNFNLRGDESDADEQFVIQLAEDLNLEVFIESFETEIYAKENKLSSQMAARELRYNWFYELAGQLKFDYILTAHHADDNLETFLINLSRGTGLDGLTGIPEINGNVVRPLLKFSREDIELYAKENQLKWREDSSNASTKYLRNKLRHELIPKFKQINPQLLENFKKTQHHLQGTKALIDDRIEEISNPIIDTISEDSIHYNIAEIQKLNDPRTYLYELLKDYNFTEWNDVNDLLKAQSGKQVFSATHRLVKDRDYLILTEMPVREHSIISIDSGVNEIQTPLGNLIIEEGETDFENSTNSILMDKALLKFPLVVRSWQEGDYFYPSGMHGKKKLSKYFKDEKFSVPDKENSLLLCSGEDIVWVIGRRPDNRFKVTENTKLILKIEIKK